jgi:O-methyltransferase domain
VAAKLGVADALAEGPRTGPQIAAAVGADPDALTRVLRGLVLEEVLAEAGEGRFALTKLGEWLRADVAGSMRGGVLARGELYDRPAAGMLAAVQEGGTAFEQVYGDRFFEYLSRNPEQEAVFQGSMTGRAEDEAGHVVAAYDFGGLGRLVDVGGGYGILLGAILQSAPDLRAVLVDQPAVIRMDLYMLVLLGARERTEAQFRRLLAETGFAVRRVVPTASPAGLSVIEAAPAASR